MFSQVHIYLPTEVFPPKAPGVLGTSLFSKHSAMLAMHIRVVFMSQKLNLAQHVILLQSTRLCIATDLTPDTIQRHKKLHRAKRKL